MPPLSRRQFARVFAGLWAASAQPGGITLDAIAAPRLPRRLIVHNVDHAAVFELRVYGSHPRAMHAVMERHGIRPVLRRRGAYLIPFESLETRQRAWDLFNADPDWQTLRADRPVHVKEISLYRLVSL
jgi:hypothetical protein